MRKIFKISTNWLSDFLGSVGLSCKDYVTAESPQNHKDYKITKSSKVDKLLLHRDFLKGLEEQETKRLEVIESKTSQLIAQTGIVFTLLSLFIPLMVDKANLISSYIKIILVAVLICAFIFYILTITNALKNFRINNFKYASPSPENVLQYNNKGSNEFVAEEIRDLLYAININKSLNNRKGTNLLHSYFAFRYAIVCTGILGFVFSLNLLFLKSEDKPVKIEGNIRIDSLVEALKQIEFLDTVVVKNGDLILVIDSIETNVKRTIKHNTNALRP